MVTTDSRVAAYIDKAPDHARAILTELRERVHLACPDVVETIKWRAPAFEHHGFLCAMAAFKDYCSFMFWREKALVAASDEARLVVKQCGRITKRSSLPGKAAFKRVLRAAMVRNESSEKTPRVQKRKPRLSMPADFRTALAKSRRAQQHFDDFAASYRRDYIAWIVDCKRDSTRQRRIEQAVEWLAAGKRRNWKYENC